MTSSVINKNDHRFSPQNAADWMNSNTAICSTRRGALAIEANRSGISCQMTDADLLTRPRLSRRMQISEAAPDRLTYH